MRYENLILQLQQATRMPGSVDQELIRNSAATYANCCVELQRRVSDAVFFLDRGFRSEAIRICEMEPNCFNEIEALDFPERGQWLSIALNLGIHTPDLPFQQLRKLNDAYDFYNPRLAQKYRLFNILDRPRSERITVLRSLLKSDPQNAIWKQNLRELESQ